MNCPIIYLNVLFIMNQFSLICRKDFLEIHIFKTQVPRLSILMGKGLSCPGYAFIYIPSCQSFTLK